jgi:hypothetical protein
VIHIHEAQRAEAVEPGVGHPVDDSLLRCAGDLLLQLPYRALFRAARAESVRSHLFQAGGDLLAQLSAGVWANFLSSAVFMVSPLIFYVVKARIAHDNLKAFSARQVVLYTTGNQHNFISIYKLTLSLN